MSATLPGGNAPIKVLTADEHPLVREALARLVAALGREVTALEADSLSGIEALVAAHRDLSLAILDVALPGVTAVEVIERVLAVRPELPVLVVSSQDDPDTARAVLDAGARGFISKRSPTRVLVEAIRLVVVAGILRPPQALGARDQSEATGEVQSGPKDAPDSAVREALGLTPRQFDVLKLLVQGAPNKLISRSLNLAEGTVKAHIEAIFRTLRVANRTQAGYALSRCEAFAGSARFMVGALRTIGAR